MPAPSAIVYAPDAPRAIAALGRRSAGFTLLEVLLSISIIAIFAAILIGGASRLMADKPVSVDESFWLAVREARKAALKNEREVYLTFVNEKEHDVAFVLTDAMGLKQDFPINPAMREDLTVSFFTTQKGGPLIMVNGVVLESKPSKSVTFYPDGTCTAFRLQVSRQGGAHMLSIDPWTCAQILTPADPYAPKP